MGRHSVAQLREDAANRALRSLVQGLIIDVAVAVCLVLSAWLPDADLTSREAWIAVGLSVARSVLQAVVSWVMRRYADGSAIPTPLPPAEAGAPNDTEETP